MGGWWWTLPGGVQLSGRELGMGVVGCCRVAGRALGMGGKQLGVLILHH